MGLAFFFFFLSPPSSQPKKKTLLTYALALACYSTQSIFTSYGPDLPAPLFKEKEEKKKKTKKQRTVGD